jgi:hypothetical protein
MDANELNLKNFSSVEMAIQQMGVWKMYFWYMI